MRKTKRTIIKSYHNKEINELKDKMNLTTKEQFQKPKTRLFVPSMAALVASFILVVVSLTLFFNNKTKNDNNPQNTYNTAINHLIEETVDYLKNPVKTIVDSKSDVVISIYYGLVKGEAGELNHYLVIEYESANQIDLETAIYELNLDEGDFGANASFCESFDADSEAILSFKPTTMEIFVKIMIENELHDVRLDLNEYYQYLKNKNE